MGTVRLLLAISVVIYHSFTILGFRLTPGRVSVEAFFLISGFFMALIIHEKYTPGIKNYVAFFSNRFMRLYPVYFVVTILTLAIGFIGWYGWGKGYGLQDWFVYSEFLSLGNRIQLVFSNLTLLGSDITFFQAVDLKHGGMYATMFPLHHTPYVFRFIISPQMWTIGIELTFYALAPLLLRRNWKWQVLFVLISLYIRYWLMVHVYYRYASFVWDYHFFPNELALFITGSLMYKCYLRIREKQVPKWLGPSLTVVMLALIFAYPFATYFSNLTRPWIFYILFAACMPVVFHWSGNRAWDRKLGDLSYPIYCVHMLIISLIYPYFFGKHNEWYGIVSVVLSLIAAWFLKRYVADWADRYRRRRFPAFSTENSVVHLNSKTTTL